MLRNPDGTLSQNLQRTALAAIMLLCSGCNTLHLKNIPAFTDSSPQIEGSEKLPTFVEIEIPFANTGKCQTLPPVDLHVGQGLKIKLSGAELHPVYGSDIATLKLVNTIDDSKWQEHDIRYWPPEDKVDLNGEYVYSWEKIREALTKIENNWEFQIVLCVCIKAQHSKYLVPVFLQNYIEWEK
ncbi:MAG: hypothetical protein PHU71_00360 [Candidatus Gracilibacteria bacterium]|nr:hypothetical protein [Candidatus Gracilibacteria bacterium]